MESMNLFEKPCKYYAYIHYRHDNGKPFYVGKGCGPRAFAKTNRQIEWTDTVKECGGFTVKLVDENISEEQAYELEDFLTKFIGLENLVNRQHGGRAGVIPEPETREKLRTAMTGRVFSEESIRRMSEAAKGNKKGLGRIKSPEERAKISAKLKGHAVSEEARAKIAAASRAYTRNDAYRAKMSAVKLGVTHTDETKKKISDARRATVARKKALPEIKEF